MMKATSSTAEITAAPRVISPRTSARPTTTSSGGSRWPIGSTREAGTSSKARTDSMLAAGSGSLISPAAIITPPTINRAARPSQAGVDPRRRSERG